MKCELKINDGVCVVDDLEKAMIIINSELFELFSNDQCFSERLPFSVGVLEYKLYSNDEITDDEIALFGRIKMLLNRICDNESKSPTEYIKHNYIMHYEDEYIYDLKILSGSDNVLLDLNVDSYSFTDYLRTNMFKIEEGKSYYFESKQTVVVKSENDRYELGEEIEFSIYLRTFED